MCRNVEPGRIIQKDKKMDKKSLMAGEPYAPTGILSLIVLKPDPAQVLVAEVDLAVRVDEALGAVGGKVEQVKREQRREQ
jgi:hypothetical protein